MLMYSAEKIICDIDHIIYKYIYVIDIKFRYIS